MRSSHYMQHGTGPIGDGYRPPLKHLFGCVMGGMVGGIFAYLAVQALLLGPNSALSFLGKTECHDANAAYLHVRGEPWVGSTLVESFPPATPTNYYPSLFPTNVGYLGTMETGAEPGLIVTAPSQPIQTGAAALVVPPYSSFPKNQEFPSEIPNEFHLFRSWGNLSPWYSVPLGAFGIYESSASPADCSVEGAYLLYRHGARYPSSGGGTSSLAQGLEETANEWNATGKLTFLNDWTYKLGEEILTTFGRQQEFDLGVSMRLKYGFLLNNFTSKNIVPVFRTTSEDRMLASAVNFGLGFFGWPTEGQYELTVLIESTGFNNTLHPTDTCPNSQVKSKASLAKTYVDEWMGIYLVDAQKRIQADIKGFNLTVADVYYMQEMCVYETISIGHSLFCELFTEEEWEGFDYSIDLDFWYDNAFGSPVARVLGLGYVQELVSRLTQTPIQVYNSSTNSTWDSNSETWPLGDVLYADATHDTVIANILTALNLESLARTGPLPATEIPPHRSYRTSQVVPFGSNVQFQLLSCPAAYGDSQDGKYMRVVLNDSPVPLNGIGACPESESWLCPLSAFTEAQRITSEMVDWYWGCYGNWSVPPGYSTTGGWYPPPPTTY